MFGWARAHGRRFYNFDGLDRFKAKLHPDAWLPVFAVVTAPSPTPALMWGVFEAVVGGPPLGFMASAGVRAVRSEWAAIRGRVGGREKQKGPG
jgi:phosphatidylglycerol lysyltransferase